MKKDQQRIKRRVFNDAGELIREGLVPTSVENSRPALMEYWGKEDALLAEAEAAAAAEAVVVEESGPSAEELVGPLVERLEALEARLGAVDQVVAATPDEVLAGTMAIQRAASAASLINAAGEVTVARVEAVAAEADNRLAAIEGQVLQSADAVGNLLSDAKLRLGETSAEMLAKTTSAISKRIAGLEVAASQLRGPKGARGRIGQGMIAGAGKRPKNRPDNSEWALGDSFLNTAVEGFTLEYLSADGWSRPIRMVPAPRLHSAQITHVDQAPKATVVLGSSGKAGNAGGGSDRLATRTIANGALTTVADSSNWSAGGTTINSCIIHMRISTGTGSAFLSAAINVDPDGKVELTEYSLLGSLTGTTGFSVDLSARLGTPVIPAGVTPPAAGTPQPAMFVTAMVRGLPPTGGFLEGVVIWMPRAHGSVSSFAGISPLWIIT